MINYKFSLNSSLVTMNYPKWLNDMPDGGFKQWSCYLYYHPQQFWGTLIGVVIALLFTLLIICLAKWEEFNIGPFKFTRSKKQDKDISEEKEKSINELERKVGALNEKIDQQDQVILEKNKEIRRLLNVQVRKDKQVSAESIAIQQQLQQENKMLRDNIKDFITIAGKTDKGFLCLKNAIFYITSDNTHFNRLMQKLLNREEINEPILQDFYMDLQYNLIKNLTCSKDDVRVSIMKYDEQNTQLQIVCKLGTFNCSNGEFVLRRGQGFAGLCLLKGCIINVGNVNSMTDYNGQLIAIDGLNYKPPIKNPELTLSSLHIPIFMLNSPVGVINITSPDERAFTYEDELISRLYAEKISRIWTLASSKN